jgi:hypothetical protein
MTAPAQRKEGVRKARVKIALPLLEHWSWSGDLRFENGSPIAPSNSTMPDSIVLSQPDRHRSAQKRHLANPFPAR